MAHLKLATGWRNPPGHSGFSPDIKRNVHPSKKISQGPVKADHLLRKLMFLQHLQPLCDRRFSSAELLQTSREPTAPKLELAQQNVEGEKVLETLTTLQSTLTLC